MRSLVVECLKIENVCFVSLRITFSLSRDREFYASLKHKKKSLFLALFHCQKNFKKKNSVFVQFEGVSEKNCFFLIFFKSDDFSSSSCQRFFFNKSRKFQIFFLTSSRDLVIYREGASFCITRNLSSNTSIIIFKLRIESHWFLMETKL